MKGLQRALQRAVASWAVVCGEAGRLLTSSQGPASLLQLTWGRGLRQRGKRGVDNEWSGRGRALCGSFTAVPRHGKNRDAFWGKH